eukprot:GCRY01001376.1.p1 GENE.GCRY01001376.1~~GCRY01001376.1.p1  ORF type:complete len:637 (-),score=140.53 GCRY01001376.1:48-1868(-)
MKLTLSEVKTHVDSIVDVRKLSFANADVSGVGDLSACENLQRLDLSNNNLTKLEGFLNCQQIKWLSLLKNHLTNLEGIETLTELGILNVSDNRIRSLPSSFSKLSKLQALIIKGNELLKLQHISNLTEINTIVVSDNKLTEIVKLQDLEKLTKLSAGHNRIREFPDFSGNSNIKEIRLNNNLLTSLPKSLPPSLSSLRILELGNNSFKTLKDLQALSSLKMLDHLNLKGNPVTDVEGYREWVLKACPRMRVLDGLKIDDNPLKEKRREFGGTKLEIGPNRKKRMSNFENMMRRLEEEKARQEEKEKKGEGEDEEGQERKKRKIVDGAVREKKHKKKAKHENEEEQEPEKKKEKPLNKKVNRVSEDMDSLKKKKKKKTEDASAEGEEIDLTEKKKKKKKAPKDEDEEEEEIDLSEMKKKRKSKKKVSDDLEDSEEEEEQEPTDGKPAWVFYERDYKYEELLKRIYDTIYDRNPELRGERKRAVMKPPHVVREGTKKTVWVNFPEMCKTMNRNQEHVLAFCLAELGTSGSQDGNGSIVIRGRFNPKQIENIVRRYIVEYVTCRTCKSPDTALEKQNRLLFVKCNHCSSSRSVASIQQGYKAQIGKRKK